MNAELDWPNMVEEGEDLWRELHAVESLVEQALAHLLKLRTNARKPCVRALVRRDPSLPARRWFTPSMRQRLDLDGLYGAGAIVPIA